MIGNQTGYATQALKPAVWSGIQQVSARRPAKSDLMSCREFADFMIDYLSGELSSDSRTAFDGHLSVCSNCRRYLAAYEESVTLGKRAFEDDDGAVPPDVPEQLIAAILTARRAR
jgi:anti-sigma factor RsiW